MIQDKTSKTQKLINNRIRIKSDFDILFPLFYSLIYLALGMSIHLLFFPIGDIGVETDFYGDLVVAAQNLQRGNFSVANYPYKGPFYSFVLIFLNIFVGDWYLSGVLMNGICAACGLFVLYRLLLRVFNRPVAALSVVSVSLVSEFFVVAHKASSDMLFFVLCFLAIYLLLVKNPSRLQLAAAGILSALAFLTRYNGVFLPLSAIVIITLVNPGRRPRRHRLMAAAIYIFAFLLVCSPWFVKNSLETGSLLETRNFESIEKEFYGNERELYIPEGGFNSVREIIAHDPIYFVKHYMLNILRIFWRDMVGTLGLPAGILVLLGLIGCLLISPKRYQWAFFVFPIVYLLVISVVFHLPRLSLPLTPAYYALVFSFLTGFNAAASRSKLGKLWNKFFIRRSVQSEFENGARPRKKRTGKKANEDPGGKAQSASEGRAPHSTVFHNSNLAGVVCTLMIIVLLSYQVALIVRVERRYYDERPLFVFEAAEFLLQPSVRAGLKTQPVILALKPHIAYYSNMRFRYHPKTTRDYFELIGSILSRNADFIQYSVIEDAYYESDSYRNWLDITPGIEKIYDIPQITIYKIAEWLDLESGKGKEKLASMRLDIEKAEAANDQNRIPGLCYNLSRILMFNKEWEEAAAFSLKALTITQQNSELKKYSYFQRFNLSQAYLRIGRHEEGIAVLDEYIRSSPLQGNTGVLANMHILVSRHWEKLGRKETAIENLQIAHDLFLAQKDQAPADYVKKEIKRIQLKN